MCCTEQWQVPGGFVGLPTADRSHMPLWHFVTGVVTVLGRGVGTHASKLCKVFVCT
jgi:hypothetical protein